MILPRSGRPAMRAPGWRNLSEAARHAMRLFHFGYHFRGKLGDTWRAYASLAMLSVNRIPWSDDDERVQGSFLGPRGQLREGAPDLSARTFFLACGTMRTARACLGLRDRQRPGGDCAGGILRRRACHRCECRTDRE